MSNITGDEGSFSSGNTGEEILEFQEKFRGSSSGLSGANNSNGSTSQQQQQPAKKKRKLPGTPDPNAEVVALSPTTLMATNRFVCEICNKGFQRDQNLQLHRRGHNLPWKLRQRTTAAVRKKVYICPEPTCVHHNPSRALGDLTGIKKHFSRKHGEKKWKCDKCFKKYAVQSDCKAHQKTCGTREYKCDCGTIFSRRDGFIAHRAFCNALAEENNKVNQRLMTNMGSNMQNQMSELMSSMMPLSANTNTSVGMSDFNNFDPKYPLKCLPRELVRMPFKSMSMGGAGMFFSGSGAPFGGPRGVSSTSSLQLSSNSSSSGFHYLQNSKNCTQRQISGSPHTSAIAFLQKAAKIGATASNSNNSLMMQKNFAGSMAGPEQLSSTRPPSYDGIQQHTSTPYDHFPIQADHHQTNMVGINGGGFNNQPLMQKSQQDVPLSFDALATGSSAVNEMEKFASVSEGRDQNPGYMRGMKHEDRGNTYSSLHGRTAMEKNPTGMSMFGTWGSKMHAHDFLAMGRQMHANLHEQPHHQQQQQQQSSRQGKEAMSQQRLPTMNHLRQHQSLLEDSTMEKPTWDF